MLVYFNGEILKNVSLLRNNDNSILGLACNEWRIYKSSNDNSFSNKSCSYVSVPDKISDTQWTNCKIGFINLGTLDIIESEIILDYLIINKIEIQRKKGRKNLRTRHGCYANVEYTEFYYKIEMSILEKDSNRKITDNRLFVFNSYDILWKGFEHLNQKYAKTMHYLFIEFPNIIKEYIEGGINEHYYYERPLCLLNEEILQKGWPSKDKIDNAETYSCVTASHEFRFDRNYREDNWFYSLDNAIRTLHTIEVEKNNNEILVKFGNGNLVYLNIYFERFFEFAFNQRLLYDKKTGIASCKFNDVIPFGISNTDEIAAYIACVMHLYLFQYFDSEASRQLHMVSIPQSINEYDLISTSLTKMKKIDVDESFYNMYKLMYCCKIEHKLKGDYRVGRDDYETMYKSFQFFPRKGYKATDAFINKINSLLQIELKYEEEYNGLYEQPERYYYRDIYYHGTAAGSAENGDLGSAELRDASFNFISNYFIFEYLTDKNSFKRFL